MARATVKQLELMVGLPVEHARVWRQSACEESSGHGVRRHERVGRRACVNVGGGELRAPSPGGGLRRRGGLRSRVCDAPPRLLEHMEELARLSSLSGREEEGFEHPRHEHDIAHELLHARVQACVRACSHSILCGAARIDSRSIPNDEDICGRGRRGGRGRRRRTESNGEPSPSHGMGMARDFAISQEQQGSDE